MLTTNLDVATRIIELVKTLGDATPLSSLKPICGIALVILENAQAVHQLKDDHKELAARAAELVVALLADCATLPPLSAETENHIKTLLGPLERIRDYMEMHANLTWFDRLLKRKELEGKIALYKVQLDDCRLTFNIQSLISIRRLLESNPSVNQSNVMELVTSINTNLDHVSRQVNAGLTNVMERLEDIIPDSLTIADVPQFRVLRYDEVKLRRTLRMVGNSWLYRGELPGEPEPTSVVVKAYMRNEKGLRDFLCDIHNWQNLHHPNLHRVVGHSSRSASAPFLLLADCGFQGVHEYMREQLNNGEVDSFMSALKLLQGIVSALEFLRCSSMLNKREIDECAKDSNIIVAAEGRVVIGNNLVSDSQHFVRDGALSGDWLEAILYNLAAHLVRGLVPIDQSDWNWTMARTNVRPARHLRILENFVCFMQPSLTAMAHDLDATLESLEDLHARGQATFPLIRQAVLAQIPASYIFRPKVPLEVAFGDIGYIEDGNFIVLENVRDVLGGQFANNPPYRFICDCEYHIGQPDGTGLLRHRFIRPLYVEIRRNSGSEIIRDRRVGWDYLISNVARIHKKHSINHSSLRMNDIMLVHGVESDLRYTLVDCKTGCNERTEPPEVIEFVECETVHPEKSWGHWVIDDTTDIEIQEHRHPQNIIFVQLEESEVITDHISNGVEEVK